MNCSRLLVTFQSTKAKSLFVIRKIQSPLLKQHTFNENNFNAQLAQLNVNGSNIPVAVQLDMSLICSTNRLLSVPCRNRYNIHDSNVPNIAVLFAIASCSSLLFCITHTKRNVVYVHNKHRKYLIMTKILYKIY